MVAVPDRPILGLFHSLEAAILGLPLLFVSSVAARTALDAEFGETVPDESPAPALGRYATWLDLGQRLERWQPCPWPKQ